LAQPPVITPARFVPTYAVGYSSASGEMSQVSAASPLPVALAPGAAATPLEATTVASTLAGPFIPTPGLAVVLNLRGTWSGTVNVMRSTDGGTTLNPLTVAGQPWARFSGNACEPVWEENDAGARLYLDIALTSGSLSYRLGH
jgi:hypothetical protein